MSFEIGDLRANSRPSTYDALLNGSPEIVALVPKDAAGLFEKIYDMFSFVLKLRDPRLVVVGYRLIKF